MRDITRVFHSWMRQRSKALQALWVIAFCHLLFASLLSDDVCGLLNWIIAHAERERDVNERMRMEFLSYSNNQRTNERMNARLNYNRLRRREKKRRELVPNSCFCHPFVSSSSFSGFLVDPLLALVPAFRSALYLALSFLLSFHYRLSNCHSKHVQISKHCSGSQMMRTIRERSALLALSLSLFLIQSVILELESCNSLGSCCCCWRQ